MRVGMAKRIGDDGAAFGSGRAVEGQTSICVVEVCAMAAWIDCGDEAAFVIIFIPDCAVRAFDA